MHILKLGELLKKVYYKLFLLQWGLNLTPIVYTSTDHVPSIPNTPPPPPLFPPVCMSDLLTVPHVPYLYLTPPSPYLTYLYIVFFQPVSCLVLSTCLY